ncbi:MAG TPA: hypothetical protein EYO33_14100 [Phycisphaerales bacterium]|nr:hypothetical protein [Phycisphaerales bacterium]
MFPLLAIPAGLGWVISRYWLRRETWPAAISVALCWGIVSTLIGVNFFYRRTTLESSVSYTLAIELVALALLWFFRPKDPVRWEKLPQAAAWTLVGLTLYIVTYATAQQIASADDDYWIHAPLQGLMRHGNFPPTNPFFSDIPMNGHYGRNLSIVTFSYLSGFDVFLSQHVLTSVLQGLTLWLFYSAFLASSGRQLNALLGTAFVFFGINAGGRGGLTDTMQNNNPYVHLYLGFLCYMTVLAWKEKRWTAAVLGGLGLGSYAIVYETHFGLVFFTILGVTPILWAAKFIDRQRALCALTILGLSLPLAFTQGGPLTDLLDRKVSGREHTQAENLSKGMQNQAQVVKVSFPKEELFQILLETGEYQRISNIYTLNTPLRALYKPSTDRGYAYIWSWDVLKIHFLALYLVPLSAFILLKRGSLGGLFMGAFGTISFLVPALVNFGPIYESEYFRWEFAASLGFAGALGLALGALTEKGEGRPFRLNGHNIVISSKGKIYLLVALITLVNSYSSLHATFARIKQEVGLPLSQWLYFPPTQEWLASHLVLEFGRVDYEAAKWLEERVEAGDRVLVNFSEENNFSILYESTLTGVAGARSVGHALPLEDEKIGTTPFRRSPAAQLFWQTQRPESLAQLKVDWLFYRGDGEAEDPEFPAARLEKRFKLGERRRFLYRVDESKLPKLYEGTTASQSVSARIVSSPKSMRGGEIYNLQMQVAEGTDQPVKGTVTLSTVRKSDGLVSSPSENLKLNIDWDPQAPTVIELPFVAPYDEGEYELHFEFSPAPDSLGLEIETLNFSSSFNQLLSQVTMLALELENQTRLDQLPQRTLLDNKVKLELPEDLPFPRQVLAGWAFYSVEKDKFDLPPGFNLKEVTLTENLSELPLVTPKTPGKYRLSLYLSSGQGHLVRVLGRDVEVLETER